MPQDTPSRKLDQYIVRFPDGMRDRLRRSAEINKRSMNAEIVARLERSLAEVNFGLPEAIRKRVQEAAKRNHRRFEDELWHGIVTMYPPDDEATPPIPTVDDVSDFEREFVQASHEMMLRLMRKHGMNPVDSRDLLPAGEHPTPLPDDDE